MNKLRLATGLLLLAFAMPTKVLAHAIETNYLLLLSKLEFRSTYSTGEPVQGAEVKVFAPNDMSQPWKTIMTNEEGRFAFAPDPSIPGNWEVEIKQEGHEDYWTVPVGVNGIEEDNISQEYQQDLHFAGLGKVGSCKLLTLAGIGAAGAAGGLWFFRKRALDRQGDG